MDILISFATPLVLAVIAAVARPYLGWFNKRDALRKFKAEPLYKTGAKVAIYTAGVGTPLFVGTIHQVQFGRILLRRVNPDGHVERLVMRVEEFVAAQVVVEG